MAADLDALGAEPDPELAQLSQMMAAAVKAAPPMWEQDPIEHRHTSDAYARSTRVPAEQAVDRVLDTDAGPIEARVLAPSNVSSVYLYIHGGAWMMGANDLADEIMWARAERADTAVVSINYRLAPENPWPAGADDCLAAAQWVIENAKAEFGTDRILIGGESAGAHLSAVTLLRVRDELGGEPSPFCGAELRYGMYDMRLSPSARQYKGAFLDARQLEWVLDLSFAADLRDHPLVSPLLADLRAMPPALFSVGTDDSLVDDTVFMWTRWRAAGNAADLDVYPGGIHAFDYFPSTAATRVLDRSIEFIKRCASPA
jgi:acetyl esterase/lipase